jgi:hypothetical protein
MPIPIGTDSSQGVYRPQREKRKKKYQTPAQPVLRPPLEAKVRNLALGYHDANGALPGPGKMVDLLDTALADINDQTAWREFFSAVLNNALVGDLEDTFRELTVEDVLYDGDLRHEEPTLNKVIYRWGPGVLLTELSNPLQPFVQRSLEKDIELNPVVPRGRSLEEVQRLTEGNEKMMLGFYVQRGIVSKPESSDDPDAALAEGTKRWAFGQNIADAVIKGDKNAIYAVQETGLLDPSLTPRQALTAITGDRELIKDYVYQRTFESRHPHFVVSETGYARDIGDMSPLRTEYEFIDWYRKQYGAEWLPDDVRARYEADEQGSLWRAGFTDMVKYVTGVDNPEWAKMADATYRKVPGGKELDAAYLGIIDSISNSPGFKKSLHLLNLPLEYGNQGLTALGWTVADVLEREAGREWWDANKPLIAQFGDNWKQAGGKSAMAEWLRAAGVEPANHPFYTWCGQLAIDTALGVGADATITRAFGRFARSAAGDTLDRGLGARAVSDMVAENKNAYIARDAFGWNVTPEDAVRLADNLNTPEAVDLWWEQRGGLLASDTALAPEAPSLRITERYKRLTDESIPAQSRALYLPEDTSPFDVAHSADRRAFAYLTHAGYDTKHALSEADRVTRLMGEGFEARKAVYDHLRALDDRVQAHLASQPAPADIAKHLKAENPTKLDAYWYMHEHFLGRKLEGPPAAAYGPYVEEFSGVEGVAQLVDDIDELVGEGSQIIDDVRRAKMARELGDVEAELDLMRTALISTRRERRAGITPAPDVSKRLEEIAREREQLLSDTTVRVYDVTTPVSKRQRYAEGGKATQRRGGKVERNAFTGESTSGLYRKDQLQVGKSGYAKGTGQAARGAGFYGTEAGKEMVARTAKAERLIREGKLEEAHRLLVQDGNVHLPATDEWLDFELSGGTAPDKAVLRGALEDAVKRNREFNRNTDPDYFLSRMEELDAEERRLAASQARSEAGVRVAETSVGEVDASVAREVEALNRAGYKTFGSHGVAADHPSGHPAIDIPPYIEFDVADLAADQLSSIKVAAGRAGLKLTKTTDSDGRTLLHASGDDITTFASELSGGMVSPDALTMQESIALRRLAALGQRRQQIIAESESLTLENAGRSAPATEAQMAKMYHTRFDEEVLATLNAGKAYRKWAMSSAAKAMNTASRVFRYIVLWKFGTVLRILSDEGTRAVVNGIIPGLNIPGKVPLIGGRRIGPRYFTPEAEEILARYPDFNMRLKGLFERVQRPAWVAVQPTDDVFIPSYKGWLRNHNAGPTGQRPYQDWGRAWQARMEILTEGGVIPETEEMVREAATFADDYLLSLCRSDPYYIGGKAPYVSGFLKTNGITPKVAIPGGRGTVEEWVRGEGQRSLAMVAHKTTREHFFGGPTVFKPGDISDLAVRQHIGSIAAPNPKGVYHPRGRAREALHSVADFPYTMLDYFGTDMKQQAFGYFLNKYRKELRKKHPDLDPADLEPAIERRALKAAEDINYIATHSTLEGRMRFAFLFLPAYLQSARWWLKWAAKHPFTTNAVVSDMRDVPLTEIPDWMPVLGGRSIADLSNVTILPEDWRNAVFPVNPVFTTGAEAYTFFGGEGGETIYDTLNYGRGFDPGGPLNRPLDSFLYGVTGGRYNPGEWTQDIRGERGAPRLVGAEKIADQRRRVIQAYIQRQAISGEPVDAKAAEREVAKLEATRGIVNWAAPASFRLALPTVTVTSEGKQQKIDLQRIADAQYAYLNAKPEEKQAVLESFPEYVPVAKAWELQGNERLDFLSKNQWVIPLVTQRSYKDYENEPIVASEYAEETRPRSPADFAEKVRERYQQVWRYELGAAYEKVEKALAERAKSERKKLSPLQRQHFDDWTLPKMEREVQQAFAKEHREDIIRACGKAALLPEDGKFPWVAQVKLADAMLGSDKYEVMRDLEERGDDYSLRLVQNSPMYPEYLERKESEAKDAKARYLKAATVHYKSMLAPDDFRALGIAVPEKYEQGVMRFLGIIDRYERQLDKLYNQGKFGTDEYKDIYRKQQEAIAKGRKDATVRAILAKTPADWFVSGPNALNEPHWEDFLDGDRKRHPAVTLQTTWRKVRDEFFRKGMTPTRVLEVRRKYGGQIGDNFSEAVRAWCWAYVKYEADQGRAALSSSDNPYGWYKGWTIDSKYGESMQKWLEDELDPFVRGVISPEFAEEWRMADRHAGGNLISDLLNLKY